MVIVIVNARGVRIRGRGEVDHARRSYGVLIKLRSSPWRGDRSDH